MRRTPFQFSMIDLLRSVAAFSVAAFLLRCCVMIMTASTEVGFYGILTFGAAFCGGCACAGWGVGILCGHESPVQCALDAMTIPMIVTCCLFLTLIR